MKRAYCLVLGLAVLAGCGEEKVLPKQAVEGPDTGGAPAVVVPAASEPAALKIVERAIKATTDGHPERLDKTKANRVAMKGVLTIPPGIRVVAVRRMEAVWPDRMLLVNEFNQDGPVQLTHGLRLPIIWARNKSGTAAPVNMDPLDPKKEAVAFAADAVGRHWLALLVPFKDSKTIVFDAKKQTANGQQADTIRVSVPGCPVFTVWFSADSGLLGRVDFLHVEREGQPAMAKVYWFSAHKPIAGLTVPTRIEYVQNGQPVEEWAVDEWQFPEKIDDAVFEPK